jgi:hypothetical protein
MRNIAAEVVAAVAHALGTPLNVISGRAELIRQDPSNALVQVGRIEEQVKKVANGLRQLVDFLNPDEPAPTSVPARAVLEEVAALLRPLAERADVRLALDGEALGDASIERLHLLSVLVSLVALAVRSAAQPSVPSAERRVLLQGSVVEGGFCFLLQVPGLVLLEGWHLEHFEARPPQDHPAVRAYHAISVCAALMRGQGGKLQVEAPAVAGAAPAVTVRLSFRTA